MATIIAGLGRWTFAGKAIRYAGSVRLRGSLLDGGLAIGITLPYSWGTTTSMSPLHTILIVGVAVVAISIAILILDDVFAKLDRRHRHDDVAAMLRELTVSAAPRARVYGSGAARPRTGTRRARPRRYAGARVSTW